MVDWKRERQEPRFHFFPFPSSSSRFFPHPSLPRTQRGLCGGEKYTSKDYNDTRTPKHWDYWLKRKQQRHSLFIMEVHLAAMHNKSIHITIKKATLQARKETLNWVLPKYHLRPVYMEVGRTSDR